MDSFGEVLLAVKAFCQDKLVPATYKLFIDGIEPVSFEGETAVLSARSEFLQGIISDRYVSMLEQGFLEVLGFPVHVQVVVAGTHENDQQEPPLEPAAFAAGSGTAEYTFQNFVQGSNNKFAFAAAQAVAANPSGAYNPLFIYGDSGLGKTHLLNAIRAEVLQNHPEYKIVFVDCETFTNEIISAIRTASTEAFHNKYRAADILFVDDIQFIAGKESTQEEFFHTFNALTADHKQIVLASDRPPKEIKSLAERLRSRFESGLMADIQLPDFETRRSIIEQKAESLNLSLSPDVVEFIANHLKSNIRQLEGAVKKLAAYHAIEGVQPVIGVAQKVINDILSENQPLPITVEKIIGEVARTYNTSTADIRSNKRTANISNARKLSMYIVREITGMSMEDIGAEFGGRDHSTVVYSINDIGKKIQQDPHLKETVEDIIKNTRG